METEIPKCNTCEHLMIKIGELAGDIYIFNHKDTLIGERHPVLYQCPKCKDVKIN